MWKNDGVTIYKDDVRMADAATLEVATEVVNAMNGRSNDICSCGHLWREHSDGDFGCYVGSCSCENARP